MLKGSSKIVVNFLVVEQNYECAGVNGGKEIPLFF